MRRQTITIPVYDEESVRVEIEDLDLTENSFIPLIQVEGIKFTSQSIDIIFKAKQLMLVEGVDQDETCLIQQPIVSTKQSTQSTDDPVLSQKEEKKTVDEPEVDVAIVDPTIETDLNEKDSLTLKSPGEVYQAMYTEALEKAMEMRDNAISKYLEAQGIKHRFLRGDAEYDGDGLQEFLEAKDT